MKIHTDSFFTIGSSHQVCQDYALHCNKRVCNSIYEQSSDHVICISDGCSTAPKTDIGARLFCLELLETNRNLNSHTSNVLAQLRGLRLNEQSGLCTAIRAYKKNNEIISEIWGDGVLAGRYLNGDLHIIEHRYSENAPYYPAYKYIDKGELHYTYLSLFQNVQKFFISDKELDLEAFGTLPHAVAWTDTKVVGIFSDGVGSFINNKGEKLPVNEVVTQLMNFNENALAGEFVKRRAIKVIKDLKKRGYSNYDDVSFAAIYKTGY